MPALTNGDGGQAAPIALAFLLVVGFVFQFTFYDEDLPGFDPAEKVDEPSNNSSTFDFFDPVIAPLEAVWSAVVIFGKLLAFDFGTNTDQAPEALKWGWRVLVPGMLLWNLIDVLAP